jgi:carboxyl-terminal processing protease
VNLRLASPVGQGKGSTTAIVVGSLLLALGLTAVGDTQAQPQLSDRRSHARVLPGHDATELRILDWALWNVSKHYVAPERIDPQAMTLAGLEALESGIPEVLVQPLANGKRVSVRVGTSEREFQIGDVDSPWAVATHLREVFRFVNDGAKLDEERQRDAEYAIVAGVLSTLDPHTDLLRPEDFEDMKASTTGSFGGLGIEVGIRDGLITVIRVLDGNPASKVDMQPGDQIVQIDEQSTVTMGLTEAVQLMRGAPGTTVTVYVMREGLQKPKPLEITRATIKLDSVIGNTLSTVDDDGRGHKIGLIQIPRNFAQTTGRELRDKLDEFEKEGIEGLILDLRANPGGLLNAAVDVANAFLRSGTIVATVGESQPREESRADDRYDFPDVPIVVLIDQGSASASEIVAGALRNLGRAVLIGRRTFGKGSVQVLHDRKIADRELALKLTIAHYLTPGDESIQLVGVSPDVETIPVFIGEDRVQFFGRERFDYIREESLEAHLERETTAPRPAAFESLYFLSQGSVGLDKNGKNTKGKGRGKNSTDEETERLLVDPELRIAHGLLLSAPSSDRQDILAGLEAFVKRATEVEQERIRKSLDARKIDWTPGPPPPEGRHPLLRAAIHTDRPRNVIKGGQTGAVTVAVTNEGPEPAYQVRAITDSDYRYFDERELLFGRIDPGATKTYEVKLSVAEHELSRTDRIDVHLFEQHGAKLAQGSQTSIDISAEGLPRPQFAYGFQVLDDPRSGPKARGNGDGTLQSGERAKLRVHVKNIGEGPALDTWVNVRNLSGDAVFLHKGREQLKKLSPGESRAVELDVEVRRVPENGEARLRLMVSDNKIGEVLSERVVFDLRQEVAQFEKDAPALKAKETIDLYASPIGHQHVVARAGGGTKFATTGRFEGWYRVDLGKDGFAFAQAEDVEPLTRRVPRSGRHEPVLHISPPRIALVGAMTQTDETSIHLGGVATDEDAVRDVYITVANPSRTLFGNREKVFYQAAPRPESGKLEFAADVPLTPGNNLIEIHAREDDEVVATRRMWVLRTSGLAEARTKQRK